MPDTTPQVTASGLVGKNSHMPGIPQYCASPRIPASTGLTLRLSDGEAAGGGLGEVFLSLSAKVLIDP